MIPYLLAIAGGYLIGSATKKQYFNTGGKVDGMYLPKAELVSQKEIKELEDLVNEYYGKGGLKAKGEGYSKEDIKDAVKEYLKDLKQKESFGDGNDLERVKEILRHY